MLKHRTDAILDVYKLMRVRRCRLAEAAWGLSQPTRVPLVGGRTATATLRGRSLAASNLLGVGIHDPRRFAPPCNKSHEHRTRVGLQGRWRLGRAIC